MSQPVCTIHAHDWIKDHLHFEISTLREMQDELRSVFLLPGMDDGLLSRRLVLPKPTIEIEISPDETIVNFYKVMGMHRKKILLYTVERTKIDDQCKNVFISVKDSDLPMMSLEEQVREATGYSLFAFDEKTRSLPISAVLPADIGAVVLPCKVSTLRNFGTFKITLANARESYRRFIERILAYARHDPVTFGEYQGELEFFQLPETPSDRLAYRYKQFIGNKQK